MLSFAELEFKWFFHVVGSVNQVPYSAIFWRRKKILADLANRTPFANILPRQIPDSLK